MSLALFLVSIAYRTYCWLESMGIAFVRCMVSAGVRAPVLVLVCVCACDCVCKCIHTIHTLIKIGLQKSICRCISASLIHIYMVLDIIYTSTAVIWASYNSYFNCKIGHMILVSSIFESLESLVLSLYLTVFLYFNPTYRSCSLFRRSNAKWNLKQRLNLWISQYVNQIKLVLPLVSVYAAACK